MNDQEMNIDASEANGLDSMRDYRDDLRDLLDQANDKTGISRYRICKQMGIDSGTLSNVLAKRRHFSLDKLIQILSLLGYRMSFTPTKPTKS
jgi:transcriptional regulator with XRE-family HTH domain